MNYLQATLEGGLLVLKLLSRYILNCFHNLLMEFLTVKQRFVILLNCFRAIYRLQFGLILLLNSLHFVFLYLHLC